MESCSRLRDSVKKVQLQLQRTELHHVLAALLEGLLHQDRLQRRVERLLDVLEERPLAKPDGVLLCGNDAVAVSRAAWALWRPHQVQVHFLL